MKILIGAGLLLLTLLGMPLFAVIAGSAMWNFHQDGIDLLRVEGDRIAEVWLFSSDPVEEDAFWGAA